MGWSRFVSSALLACAFLAPAEAGDGAGAEDKSKYWLLEPTPRRLWRPLSADRPDVTESPYTVDAGAFQLEASFFEWSRNGDAEDFAAAPFNFKIGLTNDIDLQLILQPWVRQDDGAEIERGMGDTQVRLKVNLHGNDEGDWALAFMPYLDLPTASSDLDQPDHLEGGLIFPFATELSEGVGLGLMFQTDFVFDEADDAYDTEFVGTASVGVDLTEILGAYLEGVVIESTDPDTDFRSLVSSGITLALGENMVFDAGGAARLAGDADDLRVFSGITWRF